MGSCPLIIFIIENFMVCNDLFKRYAANSPDALAIIDSDDRILFNNAKFSNIFATNSLVEKINIRDLLGMGPLAKTLAECLLPQNRGQEHEFSSQVECNQGFQYLHCRIIPCDFSDEDADLIIEIRDQSDNMRLQNEEALKKRRRKLFFGLLDNLPTFVYMQRRDYTVVYANNRIRELYGESEGRLCYEVFAGRNSPCPVCPTFEVFQTGQPVEWEFTDNNGRTFLIYDYPYEDDTGEPLVIELGVDITELKNVEKELFQAQKLRAIGMLASGIAHDLNNNLVPIIFNTEYALNRIEDQKSREPLNDALQAARRAADLVAQVLEYSRQQDVTRRAIHLDPLIKECIEEFSATGADRIQVNYQPTAAIDRVLANAAQMRQLLLNLLKNAEQAMAGDGTISITLINDDVAATKGWDGQKVPEGKHLILGISDTGMGIPPEQQELIFEPFFTSKKSSGGTGMGLALVHSIVAGCKGSVLVDSTPGIGTTFSIHLPFALTREEQLEGEYGFLENQSNSVLLVDDDEAGLSAIRRALEDAGFDVETAKNGEQGLQLFDRYPKKYSLVLTDQAMDGLSGLEMSRQILEINRQAQIVICTGHIEPALESKAKKEGVIGFVRKPASPKTLVEMVKQHCRSSKKQRA